MYQYRVVTHGGKIYVEYLLVGDASEEWSREKSFTFYGLAGCYDLEFMTVWGAKRYIRKQVKADKKAAERKAEKAKDPVVVWGPHP